MNLINNAQHTLFYLWFLHTAVNIISTGMFACGMKAIKQWNEERHSPMSPTAPMKQHSGPAASSFLHSDLTLLTFRNGH